MKKLLTTACALLFVLATHAITTAVAPDETGMTLSAQEWDKNVKMGWNLGNSLESSGGETGWGNPKTTQDMIKYVKAQGFNAIRIPVRWTEQLSDETNMVVKDTWLNRVKEIVDWCLTEDMYVIINVHHEAWLDRNPFNSKKAENNRKLKALWKCIATFFRDYDQRLAFAGTNETIALVNGEENWGKPEAEWQAVQNSYNQAFVDAVRATGGKNYYRHLVVQTYACNGNYGLDGFTVPTDVVEGRMSVEFHCYDPYEYAGGATYYYWGKKYKDMGKSVPTSDESTLSSYFLRIFYDWWKKGLGVVLGEYGATCHYKNDDKQTQMENLQYYYKTMVSEARKYGYAAFAWDNNAFGNGTEKFGIFKRSTSGISVGNTYALKGICEGAGVEYSGPQDTGGDDTTGGTVIWEGDAMMDWGNGFQLNIPNTEFEAMGKDVRLILQYTLDYTDYNIIQFFYGDWSTNPSFIINGAKFTKEYVPSDVHGVGNGENCTSTITFEEAVYNILAQKGIVMHGHGIRMNKVMLANATSGIHAIGALSHTGVSPYYYTIDGRRTTTPTKGIYIKNGRKVIIK
ncbi:MAG: glycoside hydrolase family 5 protein [Prevotella sp.]|nr:glycoside hydrolase family 5 protein [Prevotella sp.]